MPDSSTPQNTGPVSLYIKALILLISFLGLAALLHSTDPAHILTQAWMQDHINKNSPAGWGLFLLIAGASTAAGVPRQLVSFLGGYVFGLGSGVLMGLAGTLMGCAFTFFYARFMARSFIIRRLGRRTQKIDAFLRDNPLSTTIIIRCMPVGSNLGTNLLAGVTSVPAVAFLTGSAIGFIPQTVIFALLGSGIHIDTFSRVLLAVLLFIFSTCWGVHLYRKTRLSRHLL